MKIMMKRLRTGTQTRIAFEPPEFAVPYLIKLFTKAKEHGDYLFVDLSVPGRNRSTGPQSQNHHINGHITQIAMETGNSFNAVKMELKYMAADRGKWKWETLPNGSRHLGSEADATVEEAAELIECAHQLAAELGITLVEG